jgi:tetratricopeptide (TPR) repeat protein
MKNYKYILLVAVTGIILSSIFIFAKKPQKELTALKNRTGPISLSGEWLDTKKAVEGLLIEIKLRPDNLMAKLNLSKAYIQESRITGDHGYYDGAALELLEDVIKGEPNNFDALCCKATVLLSQHHFYDALKVAKTALPLNPNNAFIYGLLCDAYVELGYYQAAVTMADKMISIRPDIRSYTRVSYLREIHGDTKGAIQAGKLAVNSGVPGLEETEWSRMILAHLYETIGALDTAEFHYRTALTERPNYPFALAGLGKLAKSKAQFTSAINYYEKANNSIVEYSFADELTDIYHSNKQHDKANKNAQKVINMLSPLEGNNESENGHGHYADRELSYAFLKIKDVDNALKHALIEYKRRPKNIDVCEAVAWAYFHKKEFKKANQYISLALRTNSKNPTLMARAGLIKMKAGFEKQGKQLIQMAMIQKPLLDNSLLLLMHKI